MLYDDGQWSDSGGDNVTCHYRYHGISAEGDDSEAAEHNAHQVEENTQLARLGPPLRKLARRSGVKTWRAQIN